jgi:hypothetical protein
LAARHARSSCFVDDPWRFPPLLLSFFCRPVAPRRRASAFREGNGRSGAGVGRHASRDRDIFRSLRFRPGIDGAFGGEFSLATINIEFLYHIEVGRSGWSLYQGGGPAVVLLRRDEDTSVHAGTFVTFGFAHENGFFTDFKLGGSFAPTLKFTVGYTVRKKNP